MVVVLRTIEHHGLALEHVRVHRVVEIALAELLGDHRGLHDGAVEQVARKDEEAGFRLQRVVEGADDLVVENFGGTAVLADGLAVDGRGVLADQPLLHQFADHGRHAAGMVEVLAQILAGRLHVDQQRHLVAVGLEILQLQLDADMLGDGLDVDRGIGRATDRRVHDDGVDEAVLGQDVRRLQVLMDHFDDALAGPVGDFLAIAVGRRDGGRARQLHAEGLGERVHRRGGAHGVAVSGRGGGRGHQLDELFVADLAGRHHLAGLPHDGARTGALPAEPAVQHRADRQGDRRNIHGRRAHQHGGGGLVAADGEDHAVERVAVEHFDEAEIGEVAVEPGGRALARFLDRMDRELDGDAARFADAFAHALGKFDVVAVARRQV